MTRLLPTIACLFLAAFQFATDASRLIAEEPPPKITRVRGIIDRDQTWSGHVLLTGDVSIEQGTVTVEPGTLIEFAGDPKAEPPVLTIGAGKRETGAMRLHGTADKPIIIRTKPQTPSGRIVLYLHNADGMSAASTQEANRNGPRAFRWKHVHLKSLGSSAVLKESADQPHPPVSSVDVAIGLKNTLFEMTECRFDDFSRVLVQTTVESEISFKKCRFSRPRDAALLVYCPLRKPDHVLATFEGNICEGSVGVSNIRSHIEKNIMIGPSAGIYLDSCGDVPSVVRRNYIHNTGHEEPNRPNSCFECNEGDAIVEENFFRGISPCLNQGLGRVRNNLFIISNKSCTPISRERDPATISDILPAGAAFENNIFLGPAHSLLLPITMTPPKVKAGNPEPVVFRNNVFDGIDGASRGLHMHAYRRDTSISKFYNNLFLRVSAIVYDEGRRDDTLLYADYNAVAPPAPRGFDQAVVKGKKQGDDGWGMHDVIADDPRKLGLGPLPDRIPNYDEEILSGKMTIDEVREKIFDLYRPRPGSPLIGAGRKVEGEPGEKAANIGLAPRG